MRSNRAPLYGIALVLFAFVAAAAGEEMDDDTYKAWQAEIQAAFEARDGEALRHLIESLDETWPVCDVRAMNLLGQAASYLTQVDKTHETQARLFKLHVQRFDACPELPVESIVVIVTDGCAASTRFQPPRGAIPDEHLMYRHEAARLFVQGYDRIYAQFDPTWHPDNPLPLKPLPPEALPPGSDPSAVRDPVLRAQYAEELRQFSAAVRPHQYQRRVHLQLRIYPKFRRRIIVNWYTKPPEAVAELEALLADAVLPPGEAESLLAEVKAHWAALERESNQPAEAGEGAQE